MFQVQAGIKQPKQRNSQLNFDRSPLIASSIISETELSVDGEQ